MTTLSFTGDIAFSKYFKDAWKNPTFLDTKVVDFLRKSDHVIANVECPVTGGDVSVDSSLTHASDPGAIDCLNLIGADIWTVANNHIMDCGREGLESTLQIAAENGIPTLGVGLDIAQAAKAVIIENDGADIGLLSVTQEESPAATEDSEGVIRWDDKEKIAEMIAGVKKTCRWCVMIVHAGPEFATLMPPMVRDIYKSYLDMGADVVIGHHPHVTMNYELVGDKVIFYSLGNFVFDTDYQRLQKYTEFGVFVKLNFGEDSFTWDHQGMKIDRETQTIVPCEAPEIFTNVSAEQYELLWPLAMHCLYQNEVVKFKYLFPKMKDYTEAEWEEYYQGRIKRLPHWAGIVDGKQRYCSDPRKVGDEKIRKYIEQSVAK